MEDSATKDHQSSASGRSTSRLLRYPLRSATRSKEEKPPLADPANSNSAVKKGGRGASSVSQSVGVLDLSSKEKHSKPPRRLSVPSKSNASPATKSIGNVTPISETRAARFSSNQGKSDTPLSDISKSSHRKKFSVLSSASYWLSQIRLSESAAKHSISVGFFKLALEAKCEPIQRMSDELKSYVRRHNLTELGEPVKELFESYKINETLEQLTCSQVPTEGNQLSDNDDMNSSSSSLTESEKPKEKPLDKNVAGIDRVIKPTQKKNDSAKKTTTRSVPGNVANAKTSPETRGRSMQRKPRKPVKQELYKGKQEKKSACDEGPINSPPNETQEDKENMDSAQMEESNNTMVEV